MLWSCTKSSLEIGWSNVLFALCGLPDEDKCRRSVDGLTLPLISEMLVLNRPEPPRNCPAAAPSKIGFRSIFKLTTT